jgi:hypothetical protein
MSKLAMVLVARQERDSYGSRLKIEPQWTNENDAQNDCLRGCCLVGFG